MEYKFGFIDSEGNATTVEAGSLRTLFASTLDAVKRVLHNSSQQGVMFVDRDTVPDEAWQEMDQMRRVHSSMDRHPVVLMRNVNDYILLTDGWAVQDFGSWEEACVALVSSLVCKHKSLSDLHTPTLTMKAWYDLEADYTGKYPAHLAYI